MSTMYLDRLTRVAPPRASATVASPSVGAGACRVLACTNATASVQLDSDIFQTSAGNPGSYGRALVLFHAEGNDLYLNFDSASTVVANSAATSGNTMCARVPKDQEREFELDPAIDKWVSARTINGQALTATLRYRIVSFPTQGAPGAG